MGFEDALNKRLICSFQIVSLEMYSQDSVLEYSMLGTENPKIPKTHVVRETH